MKRIVSLFIAVFMVLSMVPSLDVYAAEPVTVYLDPVNGNNANSGTEEAPVKDFAGAYALLQSAGGTIVMLDTVTFSAVTTLPACEYPVTITSKTGAEGIRSNNHIYIAGETTFENMSFTLTKQSSGTCIGGNGYKLTMGEGITSIPYNNTTYYFCVIGGRYSGDVASTDLTVMSGRYRYTYAGGYSGSVTGNAKLTMTGGISANLAPTRTGHIGGNVEMSFSGTAQVSGTLYAGAATSGNISGTSTVTLGAGASFGTLCSGSNGSGSITGGVTVNFDGMDSTFTNLKGTGGADMSGSNGGSRLVLKSGVLTKAPVSFDTVDVQIPENKTLILACNVSADTLAGDGYLSFSGASSLETKAVTGTVNCTTQGQALANHVYVTAPAGSGIAFAAESGVQEYDGKWECRDLGEFKGLVLRSDANNTITLYTGLWRSSDTDDHSEVTPYLVETEDGITSYYYPNAQGTYYVRGTRSGYIGVYQNIYMSPEEAATKTVETVTLEEKATGGYVPSNVYISTSEVLENEDAWKSSMEMFPEKYTQYMKNPVFEEGRAGHLMTTGDELDRELTNMDKADDHMYRYSLGTSLKNRDIPVLIFTTTNLTGVNTLDAAAAALESNGKPIVFYRAHMHGNEPAGGEGALAMLYMLQDGYAEELIEKFNLVVIPRLNPDGAYNYLRRVDNDKDTDPNRDQLHLYTKEMQLLQAAYLLFDPEVIIDGHERMWANPWGDMQVSAGFGSMNSDAWKKTSMEMTQAAFNSIEAAGLNGYYYSGIVNTYKPTSGGGYYPMAGTMYILQESRGIHESDESLERRVVGQMASVTGLLNYIRDHATEIQELVAAERAGIARSGATYEESELFTLDTNDRTTNAADAEAWGYLNTNAQTINWATGEVSFYTRQPTVSDKVVHSRTAPTAYVISADLPQISSILQLMDRHGIPYTYLPEGATLELQRYGGTTDLATLGDESAVRFANGCYVFTMNHHRARVLATLIEPDNIDTHNEETTGNMTTIGLLQVSDIYRYIHDLNAEGTVDYIITESEPVNITVWLDGTNGLDTNDGLTEETAVKTLEKAYAIMAAAMEGAGKGSKANLKIVGMYELGKGSVDLPKANFHVTISGKTTADGFTFTGGTNQETRQVTVGGDTTFQYMTLHVNNASSVNHLNGAGYKLVIGEGVNCTTKTTNCYFNLVGGTYNTAVDSTDITVRSGKWRNVYVGGYIGAVSGLAKGDISNCWIYQTLAPAYRGNVGSVEMKVENVTVSDLADASAIYAGTLKKSSSGNGVIKGDVTITLGENVVTPAVYAAAREEGLINGTVTILADGVDLTKAPVYAVAPTTTGTTAAAVLKLNADVTQDVTLDAALPLDLNGHNITGSLTVDGTLVVKDSQTDDFTVADGVYGQITGTITGTLAAAEGYVAIDGTSFHRFAQKISGVSIRPSIAGMYYKATWLCDEVVAGKIASYGVAVSLTDMPDATFNTTDADSLWTDFDKTSFVSGQEQTSVMIANILKTGADNDGRGKTPIYAAPYVILEDGTKLVATEEVSYSLYSVMLAAEEASFEANADKLNAFYALWEDTMKNWGFQKIGK